MEGDKKKKIRLLYVDDEVNNLTAFKATFRREYKISTAKSGKEALEVLESEEPFQIIITDQRMPEMTGIQFLQKAKEKYPDPIRILLTGYSDLNAVVDAINKGEVYRYLTKPWDPDTIRQTVDKAYEVFDLREQNIILTDKLKKANEQLEFLLRQNLIS